MVAHNIQCTSKVIPLDFRYYRAYQIESITYLVDTCSRKAWFSLATLAQAQVTYADVVTC